MKLPASWLVLVVSPLIAFAAENAAPSAAAEKHTGVFDEIIRGAGNLKAGDLVEARKLKLACLMIRDLLDERITDRQGLFSAEEAEEAREACKIADAVIAEAGQQP